MKSIIFIAVATALISVCSGQGFLGNLVQSASRLLEPVVNENNGQDGYRFRYVTDDQLREETGEFVNGIWTVKGIFEFLSPDKQTRYVQRYTADDNGFQSSMETRGLGAGSLAALAG